MSKFKEGDIIVHDGKFYVCEISGDKKALFEAMSRTGWFGHNSTGCGSCRGERNVVECNDQLMLSSDSSDYAVARAPLKGSWMWKENQYPIIGQRKYGTFIYIQAMHRYYPKMYEDFIKNEYKLIRKKKKKKK